MDDKDSHNLLVELITDGSDRDPDCETPPFPSVGSDRYGPQPPGASLPVASAPQPELEDLDEPGDDRGPPRNKAVGVPGGDIEEVPWSLDSIRRWRLLAVRSVVPLGEMGQVAKHRMQMRRQWLRGITRANAPFHALEAQLHVPPYITAVFQNS